MDLSTFQPLFDWLAEHPAWAGLMVFFVSMSESLVVVGLAVPGVVLMFGIGALIGAGVLGLVDSLLWAIFGAVVGDGVSFWLGEHYRQRIPHWWPFRKHPEYLQKGVGFFQRHGGKSILLGRFVGPLRPVIPAVAGMMGMSRRVFLVTNVTSAIAWAPVVLLPGIAFGASIELAREVGLRLVLVLVVLIAALLLLIWLVRHLLALLSPRATSMLEASIAWGARHPLLSPLVNTLVDPDHPEPRGLSVWLLILVSAFAALLWFSIFVLGEGQVARMDQAMLTALHGLRTPWLDQMMASLFIGLSPPFMPLLILPVALWLFFCRKWLALAHWLAVPLGGLLGAALLSYLVPQPELLVDGVSVAGGFPSLAVVLAGAVLVFAAVMVTHGLPLFLRWLPYSLALMLLLLLLLSETYLAAVRPSAAVGGALFVLVWVSLAGLAYRRHQTHPLPPRGLSLVLLFCLTVTLALGFGRSDREPLARLETSPAPRIMSTEVWWLSGWQRLDALRSDYRGVFQHPFNLQYLGDLQALEAHLLAREWRRPPEFGWRAGLLWLKPHPALAELPVFPHVHNGRYEAVVLVKQVGGSRQRVLRLWRTPWLNLAAQPLWLGNVTYQDMKNPFGPLYYARTQRDFQAPLQDLLADLPSWPRKLGSDSRRLAETDWQADVLLLQQGE